MSTKRIREKLLPQAVRVICRIVMGIKKASQDEVRFVKEGKSFFSPKKNSKEVDYAYLNLRSGMELAYARSSRDILYIRGVGYREFRNLLEEWEQKTPDHIRNAFRLKSLGLGMTREVFEATE